ncbi:MAG: hypothetical protein ACI9VS_001382 [Candidatus Binatia bacterium]
MACPTKIRNYRRRVLTCIALLLASLSTSSFAAEKPASAADQLKRFNSQIKPLLKEFCFDCHGAEKKKGGLNLEDHARETPQIEDRELWESVRDMLQSREMPPENKPQPMEAKRQAIVAYLDARLSTFNCDDTVIPGRVTIRRLNRAEYNNTIRDLVGVDFKPAKDFPVDEVGYGFDNIGDVLSLSPILMEKYLAAAEQVATKAIQIDYPPAPKRQRIEAEGMQRFSEDSDPDSVRRDGRLLAMMREGGAFGYFDIAKENTYRIVVRASGDQAGPEPPRLRIKIADKEIKVYSVQNSKNNPRSFSTDLKLTPGKKKISIAYLNNYVVNDSPNPRLNGDRNLYADYIDIIGPLNQSPPPPSASHKLIIPTQPARGKEAQAARETIRRFASRAYRRPVTDEEAQRLTRFTDIVRTDGGNFNEGIQLAVQAVLTSPHFLYRWELDPKPAAKDSVRNLNDYQIASRLSYFLWSSMPDEELMKQAANGRLSDKKVLTDQAARMLKDPKAAAFVENFAGQWLQIRNLEETAPDPDRFPSFNDKLRFAMRRETELFFQAIVREDRSVLELLDSDFTYLNETLARHYGIEGVKGDKFQRVALKPENNRGGVLTHASILTITSNPTRTSPVVRGKWILEQILGTPPPPPPPNVPELAEEGKVDATASLRKRLEQHRDNPDCSVCHNKMDPLGFALENYDGIGAWRDFDGKFPIDPAGKLPGGEAISGPVALKQALKNRDDFIEALTEKLLTYALGRGLEYYDTCVVDDTCKLLKSNNYKFSVLVNGIVTSGPFLQQTRKHESK